MTIRKIIRSHATLWMAPVRPLIWRGDDNARLTPNRLQNLIDAVERHDHINEIWLHQLHIATWHRQLVVVPPVMIDRLLDGLERALSIGIVDLLGIELTSQQAARVAELNQRRGAEILITPRTGIQPRAANGGG